MNNAIELSLHGDTFSALKDDFDRVLGRTIRNMDKKGADEAVVTVKLKIGLEKEDNFNGDEPDEIIKPTFKHDISSVMQVKDKVNGSMSGEYELVLDEETQKYVLRKIDDGQTTLFDNEDDEDDVEYVDPDAAETPLLESADYEEVDDEVAEEAKPTMFERLYDIIGEKLTVTESMGNYTARTADGIIVLSSASGEKSMYCPADILEKHIDHSLVVMAYKPEATSSDDDPDIDTVTVECETCFETLVTAYKDSDYVPGESEDSEPTEGDTEEYEYEDDDDPNFYEYDEPEDEEDDEEEF